MTEDVELKPCPFCGGEATLTKNEKSSIFYVFCKECLRYGVGDEISKKAVEYWNARPIEDALRAKNKRLREVLERISDEFEKDEISSFQINRWIYEVLKGTEEK